jgi:hypothetical protein
MKGRVRRRPVWGFSMNQALGCRYQMRLRVLRTRLSARRRSRGVLAVVRARL